MPLTWRNVDAPDFRASIEGYKTFSDLLGNAFGGLQTGLKSYDQKIDQRANNALMLKFAGIQDPDAAKTALSEIASDPNAYRFNADTIADVTGRPNALIQQAAGEVGLVNSKLLLDNAQYTQKRVRGFDTAEDSAASQILARQTAYASGKGEEWDKANPGFGTGLSLTARTELFDSGQTARKNELNITGAELGNAGTIISNESNRFNLDTSKTSYVEQRAASGAYSDMLARGLSGADIESALPGYNLNPQTELLVRQMLGQGSGGSGSSDSPGSIDVEGGSGYSGSGDPSRLITGGGAGNLGIGQLPDTVQTLGDFVGFARNLNNRGQASSATGIYQITGQTMKDFAPRAGVLGPNWQNLPMNAANQDKVAEAIFNASKGSAAALSGRWSSLNLQMSERIRKLPWEQARNFIAQGESGVTNPGALLVPRTVADEGSKNATLQRNANSIANAIQPALGDGRSLLEVINGLTGDKGLLKGADPDWVSRQIGAIKAKANSGRNSVVLNDAAAAMILSRSIKPADQGWSGWLNPFSSNVNNKFEIRPNQIDSYVAELKTGDYQKIVAGNATSSARGSQVAVAQKAAEAAYNALLVARQNAANNPRYDQNKLARLSIDAAAKSAAYEATIGAQGDAAVQGNGFGKSGAPPPVDDPILRNLRERRANDPILNNIKRRASGAPPPVAPKFNQLWLDALRR